METAKQKFLSRFENNNTRAFAEYLYNCELTRTSNPHEITKSILDVVDYYEVIDDEEFKTYELN